MARKGRHVRRVADPLAREVRLANLILSGDG